MYSTVILILSFSYFSYSYYLLWCEWRRNKKLCRDLRDTIATNQWRHAERWSNNVVENLTNHEHMLEALRREGFLVTEEREKVNWQKEGF